MNISNIKKGYFKWGYFFATSLYLFITFSCILKGYSYWGDEVFSVNGANSNWNSLLNEWILKDTSPPLYWIFLKIWIKLWGDSEISTRILSFIFSSLTLAIYFYDSIKEKKINRFLSYFFFITAPYFIYYSQESRNYSLLILLSLSTTLLSLRLRKNNYSSKLNYFYYLSIILLSLTHYFGLIYSLLIITTNFFERKAEHNQYKKILVFCSLLIWPIFHYLNGLELRRVSWIEIRPVLGTINQFMIGNFPLIAFRGNISYFIWIAMVFIIYFSFRLTNKVKEFNQIFFIKTNSDLLEESKYLCLLIVSFLTCLIFIDFIFPISTYRNYLVLLPATTLLLGNILSFVLKNNNVLNLKRYILFGLILIIISSNISISHLLLRRKTEPNINYKDLSQVIIESNLCNDGCFYYKLKPQIKHYYFDNIRNIIPINSSQILKNIDKNNELDKKPVIYFYPPDEILKKSRQDNDAICYEPKQRLKGKLYIISYKIIKKDLKSKHNIKFCN